MSGTVGQSDNESGARRGDAKYLPLDRFNAFSDGVFAIAITILVLEFAVPSPSVPLLPAFLELWPYFLGYIISFSFIGGIWVSHAGLTKLMKQGDSITYGLNLLMLLFVVLLPFTTGVMVAHISGPDVTIAAIIYGLDLLAASLILTLLLQHVARQPHLLADELTDPLVNEMYRRRRIAVGSGTLAVILALIFPLVAVALYLVTAVLFLVLPLISVHRARRNTAR